MATTKEKGRDPSKSATPTTSPNDTALALRPVKGEPRIDSRLLAAQLGLQHQNVFEMIKGYKADFEQVGILRFQTGEIKGRGQPEKFALLNEDQCYLLLTYSRNTAKVRALKVRLVLAFREARQAQDLTDAEYLPTYRALHDEIHALAGQSPNGKYLHLNMNRLINRAVGIGRGERAGLDVPHRALAVVAQLTACAAMRSAPNAREGYARAKDALERFGTVLLGGGDAR